MEEIIELIRAEKCALDTAQAAYQRGEVWPAWGELPRQPFNTRKAMALKGRRGSPRLFLFAGFNIGAGAYPISAGTVIAFPRGG
jgi:hypothetical protein